MKAIVRFLVGLLCWTAGMGLLGVQILPWYRWMPGGALLGIAFTLWTSNFGKSNDSMRVDE